MTVSTKTATDFYTRPLLRVRDLAASLVYYRDQLGFEESWSHAEGGRPIIAQVERGGCELILDEATVLPKPGSTSVLAMTLHAEERLGDLHRELEARGAHIARAPFEVSWSPDLQELDVEDPDGNVLVFWGRVAS